MNKGCLTTSFNDTISKGPLIFITQFISSFFFNNKVLLDNLKSTQILIFLYFVFIKNEGLKKVHESLLTCKCDAMYMLFKKNL